MIQYDDLTLDDVSYYWSGSILLRETKGKLVPCIIRDIDHGSEFPIKLTDMRTGEHHIGLRLKTFKRTVCIHHPILGYGDYKGVPIYLSPVAGRERQKGINRSHIFARCPIKWAAAVKESMLELRKEAHGIIEGGRQTLPSALTGDYFSMRTMLHTTGNLVRNRRQPLRSERWASSDPTPLDLRRDATLASVIAQCVNNEYPPLTVAENALLDDSELHGKSLSRDFALIRVDSSSSPIVNLYHRMSLVGTYNLLDHRIAYLPTVSSAARQALDISFNKLRR